MSDVTCPYCEKEIEICHDDGHGLDEGQTWTDTCPHCDKGFVFSTSILVLHEAYPAPCQNGEPCAMEPIWGVPAEFFEGKTRCKDCGREETDKAVNQAAMARYLARAATPLPREGAPE